MRCSIESRTTFSSKVRWAVVKEYFTVGGGQSGQKRINPAAPTRAAGRMDHLGTEHYKSAVQR
jgi:hypothetical protein